MSHTDLTEKSERISVLFETIHDLRNQIQSYVDLCENQVNKNQVRKGSIESDFRIKKSNLVSAKSSKDSLFIDQDEFDQQKKFILFKINQLYHLELVFENAYNPKYELYDITELINNCTQTIKVILMNKCTSLDIALNSTLKEIRLDLKIFEQILIEIIKTLHFSKQTNTLVKINLDQDTSNIQISFYVFIRGKKPINSFLVKEFYRNIILLKLINILTKKNSVAQEFKEFDFEIKIQIPQSRKRIKELQKKNKTTTNTSQVSSNKVIQEKEFNIKQSEKILKLYQTLVKTSECYKSQESSIVNIQEEQEKLDEEEKNEDEKFIIDVIDENDQDQDIKIVNELPISKEQESGGDNFQTNDIELSESQKDKIEQKTLFKKDNHDYDIRNIKNVSNDKDILADKNKESKRSSSNNAKDTQSKYLKEKPSSRNNPSINSKEIFSNNAFSMKIKQFMTSNVIFINLDDEINILRMNARIFKKMGIHLNCVQNQTSLLNMLMQIHLDHKDNKNVSYIQIIILCDHMLDNSQGQSAIEKALEQNKTVKLDLCFVLLSSTEDKETVSKYLKLGVDMQIAKPLNKENLYLCLEQAIKNPNFKKYLN